MVHQGGPKLNSALCLGGAMVESIVLRNGAVPATIAVMGGKIRVALHRLPNEGAR